MVEHNTTSGRDKIWSDNYDGSGENNLGKLLMEIRQEIGGQPAQDNPTPTQQAHLIQFVYNKQFSQMQSQPLQQPQPNVPPTQPYAPIIKPTVKETIIINNRDYGYNLNNIEINGDKIILSFDTVNDAQSFNVSNSNKDWFKEKTINLHP